MTHAASSTAVSMFLRHSSPPGRFWSHQIGSFFVSSARTSFATRASSSRLYEIITWVMTDLRFVPRDELAGDNDPLHLVRALADTQQRSVPVEPLNRIIHRIAVGAEDAHGLGGDLEG